MNREQEYSEEFLNAFVDDQLAPEEKAQAFLRIRQDETLNRRVCELRSLRDLVQLAYKHPPQAPQAPDAKGASGRRFGFNVAAGLTLMLGVLLGWLLHEPIGQQPTEPMAARETVMTKTPPRQPQKTMLVAVAKSTKPVAATRKHTAQVHRTHSAPPARLEPPKQATVPLPVLTPPIPTNEQVKVLFHVSHAGKVYQKDALDEIEGLLKFYRTSGQRARIEVVINSDGLNLVRGDTTAFAERIDRLQKEYDNLTFAACQNTIDRLKREKGIIAKLLPGVVVIDSGVAQIMRRQLQGWAYIEV